MLHIGVPRNFDFWRTVHSHGWCSLPPFRFNASERSLSRLVELSDGALIDCRLSEDPTGIRVEARHDGLWSASKKRSVSEQLATCLRLNEDLSEFYEAARSQREYRWIASKGAGRLLRAPSVFEDIVKMMCTTNCSWGLTESMVGNLVNELGKDFDGGLRTFPSANALAGVSEGFVRKNIRAGYRSPYLVEFAERVASGKLTVETWRSFTGSTSDLFALVRSVKGIGEYAAGNILRLLGRYDYLALDSWVRGKFSDIHHRGRNVSDRTIERFYAPYGKWRGLFFWLEMTEHWFMQKLPSDAD